MKDQIQKAFEEVDKNSEAMIELGKYHKIINPRGSKELWNVLFAFFKAGFNADRWIKIEEACKMPKHEEDVDIIVEGFRVADCLYTEYEDEEPGFYDERKDIIHRLENVEYWQPIILPKE